MTEQNEVNFSVDDSFGFDPTYNSKLSDAIDRLKESSHFREALSHMADMGITDVVIHDSYPPGTAVEGYNQPAFASRRTADQTQWDVYAPQSARYQNVDRTLLSLTSGLAHEIIGHSTRAAYGYDEPIDRTLVENLAVLDENIVAMQLGDLTYLRGVNVSPQLWGRGLSFDIEQPIFGYPKLGSFWWGLPGPADQQMERGYHCFPATTLVTMADGSQKAICHIAVGDEVTSVACDPVLGLVVKSGRVCRLFRGMTREWLELSCGLTVTPGHLFLNERGSFERIDEIIRRGGGIVRSDGTRISVSAEAISYSEATRRFYEPIVNVSPAGDERSALNGTSDEGWRTYNFEVEEFHTYVAEGICVHNDSLQDFLDLSVVMRNDAYVAVAFDQIVGQWGGTRGGIGSLCVRTFR